MNRRDKAIVGAAIAAIIGAVLIAVVNRERPRPPAQETADTEGIEAAERVPRPAMVPNGYLAGNRRRAASSVRDDEPVAEEAFWDAPAPRANSQQPVAPSARDPVALCQEFRGAFLAKAPGTNDLLRRIVELGDEATLPLAQLLYDYSKPLQVSASQGLVAIGSEQAVRAVLDKIAETTEDSQHRIALRGKFRELKAADSVRLLVEFMGQSMQRDLQDDIRKILPNLPGDEVVQALTDGIEAPVDMMHMKNAARAMGELQDPSTVSKLGEITADSRSRVARQASAMALANIGNADAIRTLVENAERGDELAEFYVDAIAAVRSNHGQQALLDVVSGQHSPAVRLAAVMALGRYHYSDVALRLEQIYRTESDPAVQAAIEGAVDQIYPKLVEDYEQMDQNGNVERRVE